MRILIAEDNEKLLKSLLHVFQRSKFAADGVGNGRDALDYALSGEYDGIVLDVMMPEKDGLQVLGELRRSKINTPVLLLTARTQLEQRVEGLDGGAQQQGISDHGAVHDQPPRHHFRRKTHNSYLGLGR